MVIRPLQVNHLIVSGHTGQLSQVHAGGRVVRTMGLWLIELRQDEEVLKPYHTECMVSKLWVQTIACQIISASYELLKYTGRSTVKFNAGWQTDVTQWSLE